MRTKKKFITYQEAKKFAQSLNLKSNQHWFKYCNSGKRPKNIPSNPRKIYKGEFEGWGEFLGTGNIANSKKKFLTYQKAKKVIHSLDLKSKYNWFKYCNSGKRPKNIPSNPRKIYKGEFEGWGEFLGTGTIATRKIKFLSYQEAKKFAQSLDLKSSERWAEYCNSGKRPKNIPSNPRKTYKGEFEGYGEFLGTGNISPQEKEFITYQEAKKFAQSLNLKSNQHWEQYCRSGKRPENIPHSPDRTYKDEFEGWGEFLGTGNISNLKKKFLPYQEAKKFAQSLSFKSNKYWFKYCNSGKKQENIPVHPEQTYKDEFEGWGEFLGTGNISSHEREFLPYQEAKKFAQSLSLKSQKKWQEYYSSGKRPKNIPSDPRKVYKNEFEGWGEFLGTGNIFAPKQKLLEKVFNSLEKNWKFYSRWTDGLIHNWFDELGVYTSSDPYIRSFFRKFRDFRTTPEGRKALMFWIQTRRFTVAFGEFRLQGNISMINPIEKQDYVRQRNSPILDEDSFSALKIINEIKDVDQLTINQYGLDLQIKYTIQLLWRAIFDSEVEKKEIVKLKKIKENKNKFHDTVLRTFLYEYKQVKSMKIISDFKGNFKPTLMQLYTSWKMTKTNSFFNLSRTGTGKTIAGLLASRQTKSKYTLVICPNSILKQWFDVINSSFDNTLVSIGKNIHDYNKNKHNYHVLNYNKLSLTYTINIIKEIAEKKIDFIIIDETHNVKIRHEATISERRKNTEKLINAIRRKNKNVKILCLSATPVVNNIREGKSSLEIVTGKKHNEIGNDVTIRNASKLHTAFIPHSIRYLEKYPIKINEKINGENVNAIIPNHISNEMLRKFTWLQFEQIATQIRIPEIIKILKKRTIIYTEFVSGITDQLIKAVKQEGFSVGLFTGSEKSGLEAFKIGLVDVLIASSTIAEGVDQLQIKCNNLIFNSLPYTYTRYEQVVGRIVRKLQSKKIVNITIIPVKIEGFEYDQKVKLNRIIFKKEIGRCITDGILPEKIRFPHGKLRKELIQKIITKRNSLLMEFAQS